MYPSRALLVKLLLGLSICLNSQATNLDDFFENSQDHIVLLGETHTDITSRDILISSLQKFKENRGTTFAFEMIEANYQYLLDDFVAKEKGSTQALYKYLDVRWNYNTSSYMRLLQKAKELGLNLVAIDLDKKKRPKETLLFPVNPWVSKVRKAREAHMAKVLCSLRQEKTIVIIGSFHVLDEFLPKAINDECQQSTSSIVLTKVINSL